MTYIYIHIDYMIYYTNIVLNVLCCTNNYLSNISKFRTKNNLLLLCILESLSVGYILIKLYTAINHSYN